MEPSGSRNCKFAQSADSVAVALVLTVVTLILSNFTVAGSAVAGMNAH